MVVLITLVWGMGSEGISMRRRSPSTTNIPAMADIHLPLLLHDTAYYCIILHFTTYFCMGKRSHTTDIFTMIFIHGRYVPAPTLFWQCLKETFFSGRLPLQIPQQPIFNIFTQLKSQYHNSCSKLPQIIGLLKNSGATTQRNNLHPGP